MLTLNDELLEELSLGDLSEPQRKHTLQQIYKTLEYRVGVTISGRLNESQLTAFEALIDAKDDDTAMSWLKQNVSDYQQVVQHQFQELKKEIIANSAEVHAAFSEYEAARAKPAE